MKYILCLLLIFQTAIATAHEVENDAVPVSKSKYISDGVLGTTIGFGIGHAVQGRYRTSNGWIFTAGEAGGLVLSVAGWNSCGNGNCAVSGMGSLLLSGFRIWEIADIWTTATPIPEGLQIYIVPDTETHAKLSISLRL